MAKSIDAYGLKPHILTRQNILIVYTSPMKIHGNGQAKILTPSEMDKLFTKGLTTSRDRALFAIMRYTACRCSEALALTTDDIQGEVVTFRKATTKGKLATRSVELHPKLAQILREYDPAPGLLFPGRNGHLDRVTADLILREACKRSHLKGVSTHSFRHSALTEMSNAGVPLRVIQEISGHKSLASLQQYLEVTHEHKKAAIACLK